MDDGRRLDHDLDPLVRQAEEEVRFDDLEALVRERRRVDRDLRAHAPGRVSERIVGCYVLELRSVAAAERAARGGEHDGVDRLRRRGPRGTGRAPSARCRRAGAALLPAPSAASASSPAATRLSLFASARSIPRSSVHSVARTPAKPTTALRTTSGSACSSSSTGSPPTCVSGATPSSGCEPDEAATSSRSGCALDHFPRLPADRARGSEDRDALHRLIMPRRTPSTSSTRRHR